MEDLYFKPTILLCSKEKNMILVLVTQSNKHTLKPKMKFDLFKILDQENIGTDTLFCSTHLCPLTNFEIMEGTCA